jgi:hypothetical protein
MVAAAAQHIRKQVGMVGAAVAVDQATLRRAPQEMGRSDRDMVAETERQHRIPVT